MAVLFESVVNGNARPDAQAARRRFRQCDAIVVAGGRE
jgi:hypothetical protein